MSVLSSMSVYVLPTVTEIPEREKEEKKRKNEGLYKSKNKMSAFTVEK